MTALDALTAEADYCDSLAAIFEPSSAAAEDAGDDAASIMLRGQALLAREIAARLRRHADNLAVDDVSGAEPGGSGLQAG